jgi:hypothetical protein
MAFRPCPIPQGQEPLRSLKKYQWLFSIDKRFYQKINHMREYGISRMAMYLIFKDYSEIPFLSNQRNDDYQQLEP